MGEIVIDTDRVQQMLDLVKEGRTPLAMAMLEDESKRRESQNNARDHVLAIEAEKDEMPEWMWNVLWFILGGFAWVTIDPSVELIDFLIKAAGLGGFLP